MNEVHEHGSRHPLLAERIREMIPRYEQMFAEREQSGVTPTDPLEFHLHHLARYWSRLVGFCRQVPLKAELFIDTDLGACVAVGSEFANRLMIPGSSVYQQWREYWMEMQAVLHKRPVTIELVEEASRAFETCLAVLKYDPWKWHGDESAPGN